MDRAAAAAGEKAVLAELRAIGLSFAASTGVLRPLSHHLNFLHHHGGPRLRSVQLQDDASAEEIDALLSDHDLVIVNGLQQICNVDQLAGAVARRARRGPVLGYLHETRWILDRLPEIQKQRLRAILPHLHLLLCCKVLVGNVANLTSVHYLCLEGLVKLLTQEPSTLLCSQHC